MLPFRKRHCIGHVAGFCQSMNQNLIPLVVEREPEHADVRLAEQTRRPDIGNQFCQRHLLLHRMGQAGEFVSRQHLRQRELSPDIGPGPLFRKLGPEQAMNHNHRIPGGAFILERFFHHFGIDRLAMRFRILIRSALRRCAGVQEQQSRHQRKRIRKSFVFQFIGGHRVLHVRSVVTGSGKVSFGSFRSIPPRVGNVSCRRAKYKRRTRFPGAFLAEKQGVPGRGERDQRRLPPPEWTAERGVSR